VRATKALALGLVEGHWPLGYGSVDQNGQPE
jgi:hypothetical protein